MDDALKKMKAIIQALLAKAKSTDNEHEAEAFLAKAMELMQRHQLEASDLSDSDDPVIDHMGLSNAKTGHAWRWKLHRAVAHLYGCKTVYWECYLKDEDGRLRYGKNGMPLEGYELRAVGRESAIITTDLMYPWIVEQVRYHAKRICAERKAAGREAMSEQGQVKRVAAALITRIWNLVADQKAAEAGPKTDVIRNALIVKDQVVAKFDELYPPEGLTSMKQRSLTTDGASRAAANSIGLHRQTSGRTTKAIGHG